MEFIASRKSLAGSAGPGKGKDAPSGDLTMYSSPPEAEVALEEFERFAMDRLRGAGARSEPLAHQYVVAPRSPRWRGLAKGPRAKVVGA